jgi:hypothetical protein
MDIATQRSFKFSTQGNTPRIITIQPSTAPVRLEEAGHVTYRMTLSAVAADRLILLFCV